jgi:hypothetical protein
VAPERSLRTTLLRALVAAELAAPNRARSATGDREHGTRMRLQPSPSRPRRGSARRIVRRSAVLLALLCLIGGVALASRFGSGDSPASTKPAHLAANRQWRLSGYRDHGRLCLLFAAAGELGGECGPPPTPSRVRPTSAIAAGRRYVIGFAGTRVRHIEVRAGEDAVRAATHPSTAAAHAGGVPSDLRWFVVALGGPGQAINRAPAEVLALDAERRRLGAAELDCSLGLTGRACRRSVQSQADQAMR